MWNLKIIKTDNSLYKAVADALERDIKLGILKPGERMPTHRQLAKLVGVNVTTITRAYSEAERRGLITAIVGKGTFVCSDLGQNTALVNTDFNKPGVIEMGVVLPLYSEEYGLEKILKNIAKESITTELMQYMSPQGLYRHRKIGAEWVHQYGVNANENNIIITTGAQHALICILSSLFENGDHIAVDELTYPGIKTAAKRCGIRLDAVKIDKEGMNPQSLKTLCKRQNIKGVYTCANIQNPTNNIMSQKRKEEIAEIIKKNDLLLIEDDLYGFLSYNKKNTLTELIPKQSIYIAGISKAFFAGLRVSIVVSPEKYVNHIAQTVVDTLWMTSALNVEIACHCIKDGLAQSIIDKKIIELKRRKKYFDEVMYKYKYYYVDDSMFIWFQLPNEFNSISFEQVALENGINIISSDKFAVGSTPPPNFIRVSLSGAKSFEEFKLGTDILLKTLQGERKKIQTIL